MIEVGTKVVVTTEYRGVFFGTLAEYDRTARFAKLTSARNCVKWSSANKGFLGLAEAGPLNGSRIGPAVAELDLSGITSVSACTESAIEKWEAAPWC
jgi:hypothetical protein